ncbi:MAG TPA: tetratricopeptide repeat protein [Bacteroidales bacterium]|nr:tetratricopeptide repeat protein [Bacteroidales bacterium]
MIGSYRTDKNPGVQVIALVLIIVFSSLTNVILSQDIKSKPTRQSSLEAFSKGDYEKAYSEFSELLETYPKDPLYKYYSGVCLIKMSKDPAEAESLLKDALNGATALRSLPADAFFYLGRSQQMQGKFDEAVSTYNHFTREAGKKRAKEEDVPALIQQCKNGEGRLTAAVPAVASGDENKPVVNNEEQVLPSKKEVVQTNAEAVAEKPAPSMKRLPSGYEKILDEAVILQAKADSLNDLAGRQRKEAGPLTGNEKNRLMTAAAANEEKAKELQKAADQKYSQAQSSMNNLPDTHKVKTVTGDISSKAEGVKDTVTPPVQAEKKATAVRQESREESPVEKPDIQLDTKNVAVGQAIIPVEAFSDFEIVSDPDVLKDDKIKIDPVVPDGLIYRIQVAVFRNPVTLSHFKGIKPVYGFRSTNGLTTYFTGTFRRRADASDALTKVRSKGFRDAFIVAFSGSKRVSGDRAKALEQEWGNKPFIDLVPRQQQAKTDTLPPSLSFRVEVARSDKPLKDNVTQALIKISASKGLDVLKLNDGTIVYLIGNFITFESASEYSDLLKRNGYQDAKVTAWLGKKEIPVDTARQLFDSLK